MTVVTASFKAKAQKNLKAVQSNANAFVTPTTKLLDFVGKAFPIPMNVARSKEGNIYLFILNSKGQHMFPTLPWVDEDSSAYAESDRAMLQEVDPEVTPEVYVSIQYRELSPLADDTRVNTFLGKFDNEFIRRSLTARTDGKDLPQSMYGLSILWEESGLE